MIHLTVDDIIDFVSISTMDAKSMELVNHVNIHIRSCAECLNKVKAIQLINDELNNVGNARDFESFTYKTVSVETVSDYEKKAIKDIKDIIDS